ncbi:hypothetical protein [Aquitalea sp. ASV11]|uniref:hypothetical protein n=1 Tax=Aquitalea sp. ASV11 TaxID=2795103 RepID=UPI0018EA3D5C|nr:hypothetical protein [Aquitalea sp. ASV11]
MWLRSSMPCKWHSMCFNCCAGSALFVVCPDRLAVLQAVSGFQIPCQALGCDKSFKISGLPWRQRKVLQTLFSVLRQSGKCRVAETLQLNSQIRFMVLSEKCIMPL